MDIINHIPLLGALVALLMLGLVLARPAFAQQPLARYTLVAILLMNGHNLVESWLYYNEYSYTWQGLSYMHYHLVGVGFWLFVHFLFQIPFRRKAWGWGLGIYTLLRVVLLLVIDGPTNNAETFNIAMRVLVGDYFLALAVNLYMLWQALRLVQTLPFAVQPNPQEQLTYSWIKYLLMACIGLYVAVVFNSLASAFGQAPWLLFEKLETALVSAFSLALVFLAMRFPVFAAFGHHSHFNVPVPAAAQTPPVATAPAAAPNAPQVPNEPPAPASQPAAKKYARSSLTPQAATALFAQVQHFMQNQQPFHNPGYKLNDLAQDLQQPLHHVSQVINEQTGQSFSDFINHYRVQKAKALLTSPRAQQITILAIALEAGFNSKTAFYNTFKKVTGQTPSAFQRAQLAQ